ncbi:MAG: sugar transferase [Acidobacteria bacterium]|nr:sugar transferase [Acidobacteriota bacterium]
MSTKAIETPETKKRVEALRFAAGVPPRLDTLSQWLASSRFKTVLFLAGDTLAVTLAHGLAEAGMRHFLGISPESLNPLEYRLFYLPLLLASVYVFGGYQSPDLRRPEKELALMTKAVSFFFLALVSANFVFLKALVFSRYVIVSWYLLALCLFLIVRFGLRGIYDLLWQRGLAQQRALLVGSPESLAEHQSLLSIQRYNAYRMVGVLHSLQASGTPRVCADSLSILGPLDRWEQIAVQHGVQLMVVCLPENGTAWLPVVQEIVRRGQEIGIAVEVHSDLLGSPRWQYERNEFSGVFRVYDAPRWSRGLQALLKRTLDRAVGVVGALFTVGLTAVIGLLIKLHDGGPVFYRSPFLGQDGRVHYYLKFRTMRIDADEALDRDAELRSRFEKKYKLVGDPRVTSLGRFLRKYSLDEFPQFFSVLRGELSFVGPRTIRMEEARLYGSLLPKLLSVKPGVTGFWQVMGRQTTTYDERVHMDMFYIEHWSIWLDLVIIGKTFWKVLWAEGAY